MLSPRRSVGLDEIAGRFRVSREGDRASDVSAVFGAIVAFAGVRRLTGGRATGKRPTLFTMWSAERAGT